MWINAVVASAEKRSVNKVCGGILNLCSVITHAGHSALNMHNKESKCRELCVSFPCLPSPFSSCLIQNLITSFFNEDKYYIDIQIIFNEITQE